MPTFSSRTAAAFSMCKIAPGRPGGDFYVLAFSVPKGRQPPPACLTRGVGGLEKQWWGLLRSTSRLRCSTSGDVSVNLLDDAGSEVLTRLRPQAFTSFPRALVMRKACGSTL
mmetsp:Transcript_23593/g.58276  ORF Transcript_23593/g.58276 Transcript_23593/m.58276 type:complete len:112 (+) Transcript_23593:4360-4695(+)